MTPEGAPAYGAAEGPTEQRPAVSPEFLRLLIAGRWVVIATVLLSVLLQLRFPVNRDALVVLGVITALYNAGQQAVLRAGRGQSIPPAAVIGIDLLLITLLDWFSGGVRSPFLGLYYVIIIVAAAFGDLKGSLLTAVAVTFLEALMALMRPTVPRTDWTVRLSYAINTVPFLFLTALASGYLVRRLREEWQRREEAEAELESVQREMEIAREVQSALAHTAPPRVTGFDLGTHAHTQYGIGGDIQDYVPLPDGIGVALADVAGHGLSAALLAARLAHLLEELGLGTPLPDVLDSWNRTIYERTPPEVYVTMAICELRAADGCVRYAVAGHPPPLVWRGATGDIHPIERTGAALGVLEESRFGVREMVLEPGDVMLLYTDGASEARDAAGGFLGTEGLVELMARHVSLPPQEMVDRIAEEVLAGYEVNDDMTLMAVVRKA